MKLIKSLIIAALFSSLALSGAIEAISKDLLGDVKHEEMGRSGLWRVVHGLCVPSSKVGLTFPCMSVTEAKGALSGWAILGVGADHILTIPTRKMAGVEARDLQNPAMPNLWNAAWQARRFLAPNAKGPIRDDRVVLVINSAIARSQDQLHIHTGCLRSDVAKKLSNEAPTFTKDWKVMKTAIDGVHYKAIAVEGEDLKAINVFSMLPAAIQADAKIMRRQTLAVTGAILPNGKHGFYILNNQAHGADPARGEDLLDTDCLPG